MEGGLGASNSVSRTTQFECHCICLIPRRCPALASSIWLAYSVENQHIHSSSKSWKLSQPSSLWKSSDGQALFWDFRLVPKVGERMSWEFGGSGAYFVALEV